MHREDIQDNVKQLDLELFVSELRVGTRHTVMLIPQAGFPRRYDSTSLANDRSSFGRFKPTDTPTNRTNRWIESMGAVELWHGIILKDSEMVALIDDEDRERLIDRLGFWFQDFVDPDLSLEQLDELRIDMNSADL
ncbi:MAG TPA: hypothetical protein VGB13_10485 [Candidatus Krumholzibacteria bacterium]|jgi:hypothetical protein